MNNEEQTEDPFNEYMGILQDENYELKNRLNMYESEPDIFLGKHIHTRKDGVKIFVANSRPFITNSKIWQYNRKLDENHIKELKDIILSKPCLEGNIDVLQDNNDDLCVVNGQHRYKAMEQIMEEDEKFNNEIIINVHKVTSFESNEANEIFKSTNNSKNVELEDQPNIKLQKIIEGLKIYFPNEITNNKSGKANLHRLDQKEFYNLLQYNDTFTNKNESEEYFITKIRQINKDLSIKSYEELFGTKKRTDKRDKLYKKASDSSFYLGIISNNTLAILFQKNI